jgi:hypothetical protein
MKLTTLSLLVALILASSAVCLHAQQAGEFKIQNSIFHDISPPLRQIEPIRVETKGVRRENEVHRLNLLQAAGVQQDPVVQREATLPVPIVADSFEGLGQGLKYDPNIAPPDTTGAAGKDYYIEWVNQAFVILKKDTQELVYGPADGKTIWSGFAAHKNKLARECAATNDGDPIVLYDKIDNRWILSQFSFSDGPPYLQCFAVSTTSDPLGTYARYAYRFDAFNDYGKIGIWPNGYYASYNMFESASHNAKPKGSEACVFERSKMLAGNEARMVCFGLSKQQGLLPADLDGHTLPPLGAGAPNYFLSLGLNKLNFWKFKVNWSAPKNSTLIGPDEVDRVPAFVSACDATTCELVSQKSSTSLLDTLGDRLMYRLAYRNYGDHEVLVVNHAVRVPGAENNNSGVIAFRWYEIRPSKNGLAVQQSGTFRPDDSSRWMASMAMDKVGNIAIGYSLSGTNLYPSAAFTGRLAGDSESSGLLGKESLLVSGSGGQAGARWGDYTTMSVDPVDDCTFWFVSQYLKKEDSDVWHTLISRLSFRGCK